MIQTMIDDAIASISKLLPLIAIPTNLSGVIAWVTGMISLIVGPYNMLLVLQAELLALQAQLVAQIAAKLAELKALFPDDPNCSF